jgi:radical SAM protein with 4Fe4S-binding SPASM domain
LERFGSSAEMALFAARAVAPGVRELSEVFAQPREVEIELTGKRLTTPPGSVPKLVREGRGELDGSHWVRWFERHAPAARSTGFSLKDSNQPEGCTPCLWDDLLVTFGGDGDPLLYGELRPVLQAARDAGVMGICVQTDLAGDIGPLMGAIERGLVDVVSVTMYGHMAPTYRSVSGADLHGAVMGNLAKLAPVVSGRGGVPLVVPRLLKVRETIPEMEAFFDSWILQSGWAVMDYPTDRAGGVEFAGVVDMAPPKRKACRRIWDRMVIRANGTAVACDQDMNDRLAVGHVESMGVEEMWAGLGALRGKHAEGMWDGVDPCRTCREWHRA